MKDARTKRAAQQDVKVQCFVCSFLEPLATAQDHHRTPRAFGGTDDAKNRVWLCASCHARLHRVQEFLVQGKYVPGFNLCASIFPTNAAARGNLWTLANEAATAERETKDSFAMHREHVTVNLTVDVDVWAAVKAAAKGRNTSARRLAVELLRQGVKGL
jgi:hypothetical protein